MHVTVRRPCNHALHAVLTFLTCGLWAMVWIPLAIAGRREHITYQQPSRWENPPLSPVYENQPSRWVQDPVTGQWYKR